MRKFDVYAETFGIHGSEYDYFATLLTEKDAQDLCRAMNDQEYDARIRCLIGSSWDFIRHRISREEAIKTYRLDPLPRKFFYDEVTDEP